MNNKFTENFHHFDTPEDVLLTYDESIQSGSVELYPWQIKFLRDFAGPATHEDPVKLLLRANNGAGKSQFILAPCIVWLAISFDLSLSYVTSSSASQLDTQTERYIDLLCNKMNNVHRKEFNGKDIWDVIKRKKEFHPTKSYVDLFATDEAKKAEGKHPLKPFAEFGIFIDEGKSIEEAIYGAISRCHGFTRRLTSSSPGGCIGDFYETATAENSKDDLSSKNVLGWKTLKVTSFDCPHISKNEITNLIRQKGLYDPIVRSTHFAEFTSVGEQVVIPLQVYNDCEKNFNREIYFGERRAGLDLAAGGDEVVMSIWDGNINIAQEVMRGTGVADTNPIVNEVISWIKKWKINPDNIDADDGGVGRGIISHIWDKGYKIRRVLNQWRAIDNTHYANRGTENWFSFKRYIEEYQVKLVKDNVLKSQLTNRYYKNSAKLLLQLESKDQAKAHGHPSPDRADACVLAWHRFQFPCGFISGEGGAAENGKDNLTSNQKKLVTQEEFRELYRKEIFKQLRNTDEDSLESNIIDRPITQEDIMDRGFNKSKGNIKYGKHYV